MNAAEEQFHLLKVIVAAISKTPGMDRAAFSQAITEAAKGSPIAMSDRMRVHVDALARIAKTGIPN